MTLLEVKLIKHLKKNLKSIAATQLAFLSCSLIHQHEVDFR